MGFMLLECGLGAWELALLHLVAHSCYKAHAFLGSGGVVATHVQRSIAAPSGAPTLGHWGFALLGGAALAALAGRLAWPAFTTDPRAWIAVTLLALAITPFFVRMRTTLSLRVNLRLLGAAGLVVALYALWHGAFAALLPREAAAPPLFVVYAALGAFATLFAVQVLVSTRPGTRVARTLHAWAFAGFHLDELFTRLTFLVWPPRYVRQAESSTTSLRTTVLERAA
jgi:NAD(P)H-quinone oxidoreductase subunit 5